MTYLGILYKLLNLCALCILKFVMKYEGGYTLYKYACLALCIIGRKFSDGHYYSFAILILPSQNLALCITVFYVLLFFFNKFFSVIFSVVILVFTIVMEI